MEYDYEDGHTWASYWPEVLAVFAVQNNLNNDGDVVVIDEGKQRCTRGHKRYKETSGLIEWKECQIFHSIFT